MRAKGTGSITSDGYLRFGANGNKKTEHIVIAEKAIGHPLPPGAIVHHCDRVRSNNSPANLVICPNQKYHKLLHQRMAAMEACGHADWRKCWLCQRYDSPENLYIGIRKVHHRTCENSRQRRIYRENRNVHHV